jgi:hypothetical protein
MWEWSTRNLNNDRNWMRPSANPHKTQLLAANLTEAKMGLSKA